VEFQVKNWSLRSAKALIVRELAAADLPFLEKGGKARRHPPKFLDCIFVTPKSARVATQQGKWHVSA
jgi:hypothetical protein